MSVFTAIVNSFNGGELSPRMIGRSDTAVYQIGLEQCENFVPTVEGPILKRPGFRYVADAAPSASWLGAFRFNLTQHYVIEWGDKALRLFTNGARIETAPGVPYEVATPYAAAIAPTISFQQSYDRLYLAHGDHPLGSLTRTGALTFTHETIGLEYGPFKDQNTDTALTVQASAETGTITLTASGPIFEAGQEDSLFIIEARDFSDVKVWEAGMDGVVIGEQVRSDGKIYQALTAGTTGQVQPIHEDGAAWDGQGKNDKLNNKGPYGVKWQYLSDKTGIVRIATIVTSTQATATVIRRLPGSLTSVPSWRWAHSLVSQAEGWFNLVRIWKGRMILIKDRWLIGSVAGDYGGGKVNFRSLTTSGITAADLSFRRVLATPDLPHWMVTDRKLIIGTPTREIAVGPVNYQAALAGGNIEADDQSFFGSEPIEPAQIGASLIFVQRGGRKLRESEYDFSRDRYVPNNINIWARHIVRPGAVQFAWQQEPEELLFVVRSDGALAVHPHNPAQEIKGWARIVPGGGGRVISAVCTASEDGKRDELWALIERDGVKRICVMAPWRDDGEPVQDAFYVDEGITIAASAGQTHFTGADHLAGKAVAVLANGTPVDGVSVAKDGSFDIPSNAAPNAAFKVHVGLPFTARAVTLPLEQRSERGTSQGLRKRLTKIGLRLLETMGLRVGPAGGTLDLLLERSTAVPMGAPTPLVTGDSVRAVAGGWGRDGRAEFVSDVPLPATIICALPRVELDGKDP